MTPTDRKPARISAEAPADPDAPGASAEISFSGSVNDIRILTLSILSSLVEERVFDWDLIVRMAERAKADPKLAEARCTKRTCGTVEGEN